MTLDADELAGVVDLFGAMTHEEVDRALSELAFKRGDDDVDADAALRAAVETYHLVETTSPEPPEDDGDDGDVGDDGRLYAPGPVAFPTLPPGAEDLPHILDVPRRTIDRAAVAPDVEARLRAEAARAVAAGDEERIARLLDVTYDLEAWASIDVSEVRERLDDALEER